jgi:DNA gyrase subunit A
MAKTKTKAPVRKAAKPATPATRKPVARSPKGSVKGFVPMRIEDLPLVDFINNSYGRYARLTIQDRALPDARDGLKPVQRRILFAMFELGLRSNQPHKKSVRVVGEVLGKWHPHGDQSVYDAMVRMAQDFSMRHPLVDGQGNFGSADGDGAAAMRYTEARLSALGEEMLANLREDTVDWRPNFDGSLVEPVVLPARFPNLIVNGVTGIAVGISTSILPHNLGEICNAVVYIAQNWDRRDKITVDQLMKHVPGPDFPTGGLLYRFRPDEEGKPVDMIRQAYRDGNSTLVCQAVADIMDIGGGKSEVVVTEMPYQVQKNTVLERVAAVKDKIEGLADARDESDYKGMRVVFETSRGSDGSAVLGLLLNHTQMRSSLSYNAVALEKTHGRTLPRVLPLRDMLTQFVDHRLDVITRRSKYQLKRAEDRLHLVQGYLKAISAIDEVIAIIRKSKDTDEARQKLIKRLVLSLVQADAILEMPLRRLTSLERQKLEDERKELEAQIKLLKGLLNSEAKRLEVVVAETKEISQKFATPRKTRIVEETEGHKAVVTGPIAPEGPQVINVSLTGFQRVDSAGYRAAKATGSVSSRAVDVQIQSLVAQPSDTLILVSSGGRLWRGAVARLPGEATFGDFGLGKDETIVGLGIAQPEQLLVLGTKQGNVKRVKVEDLANRAEGSWAAVIGLEDDNDRVLFAAVAPDDAHVLFASQGNADLDPRLLRFEAKVVNPQATPSARGVAGIKMLGDALVAGAVLTKDSTAVVTITQGGIAKRIPLSDVPVQGRAGQGARLNDGAGLLAGLSVVEKDSDVVSFYSGKGKALKLNAADLKLTGRAKKGQDLAKKFGSGGALFEGDSVAGVA